MVWSEIYTAEAKPDGLQISQFIESDFWDELNEFLQKEYKLIPKVEYSCCSMQAGWNIKYKKSGRAVCTLYPEKGSFICMISIGAKEQAQAEDILPDCSQYLQKLYTETKPFNGSRWLMIAVTGEQIFSDVKQLLQIRIEAGKNRKY